jgi:hypothetical protein
VPSVAEAAIAMKYPLVDDRLEQKDDSSPGKATEREQAGCDNRFTATGRHTPCEERRKTAESQ